ncbi:TetR/AcrR family transcriptional regulator [Nocardia sp. NPDC020380]|uniref:TetR/AcrR family transcriptional regulator n=1 Tax=Nocardia sp. NPDC020380 TaxID=3364309 RepID=UPI0037883D74
MPPSALRDRKRERTRRAILEAAVDQFESRGYDATTVADIAAAAEVGTRTFFNYFASKEELLFPEPDERVQAAAQAVATRRPGERPVEVLLRALRAAGDNPGDHLGDTLAARIAVLRAQVSRTVPAVSGRAAYAQLASQQEIARHLRAAFPDELDDVGAAALVGAVVGAVSGALTVLFQRGGIEDPDKLQRQIQETTSKVLAPWLTAPVDSAGELAHEPQRELAAQATPAYIALAAEPELEYIPFPEGFGSEPTQGSGSGQPRGSGSEEAQGLAVEPERELTPEVQREIVFESAREAVSESVREPGAEPAGERGPEPARELISERAREAAAEGPLRGESEPARHMSTVHRLGPEVLRRMGSENGPRSRDDHGCRQSEDTLV